MDMVASPQLNLGLRDVLLQGRDYIVKGVENEKRKAGLFLM